MAKVPSAVWIVDTNKEHLAVDEARKLGIPVVAILDTNCDPDDVDYPIPGNDDAIRSVRLLTRVIADAVADGLLPRHRRRTAAAEGADDEPLAEWERELLAGAEADLAADATARAADAATATPRRGGRRSRGRRGDRRGCGRGGRCRGDRRGGRCRGGRRGARRRGVSTPRPPSRWPRRSSPRSSPRRSPSPRATPTPSDPGGPPAGPAGGPRTRTNLTTRAERTRLMANYIARRHQGAARAHRCRNDGRQEGARRGRRRLREGRSRSSASRASRASPSARAAPPSDGLVVAHVGPTADGRADRRARRDQLARRTSSPRARTFIAAGRPGPRGRGRRPARRRGRAAGHRGRRLEPCRTSSTRRPPPSASGRRASSGPREPASTSTVYLHKTSARTCRPRSASSSRPTQPAPGRSRHRRRTSPRSPRRTSRVTRSPPTSSRTSVTSPRRRRATRASPRLRCRRSSRAASTGFFKENVLLEQAFAKDNKKTVAQVLDRGRRHADRLRALPRGSLTPVSVARWPRSDWVGATVAARNDS